MTTSPWILALISLTGVLGGCAALPSGPSVMVLPGSSKSFEAFQIDDSVCRGWAEQQIGVSPNTAANRAATARAAAGTGVGAAAGALIGAASRQAGQGAAIGAGAGLLLGSAAGSAEAERVGGALQRRYDFAYTQCMYAKGNQVPVPKGLAPAYRSELPPAPPAPRRRIPRPPRGAPPPPPPAEG